MLAHAYGCIPRSVGSVQGAESTLEQVHACESMSQRLNRCLLRQSLGACTRSQRGVQIIFLRRVSGKGAPGAKVGAAQAEEGQGSKEEFAAARERGQQNSPVPA